MKADKEIKANSTFQLLLWRTKNHAQMYELGKGMKFKVKCLEC